jgi:hypothetical protein
MVTGMSINRRLIAVHLLGGEDRRCAGKEAGS